MSGVLTDGVRVIDAEAAENSTRVPRGEKTVPPDDHIEGF